MSGLQSNNAGGPAIAPQRMLSHKRGLHVISTALHASLSASLCHAPTHKTQSHHGMPQMLLLHESLAAHTGPLYN